MEYIITPIKKHTVAQEVITKIKELVESGYLKDGDRLPPERELAPILNISRASLREGLRILSFLGVLQLKPGDGTYLDTSTIGIPADSIEFLLLLEKISLIELFEVRKAIEVEAVGLAAQRKTDEDVKRMSETLDEMKKHRGDQKLYERYEFLFHQAILEASKNSIITKIMGTLNSLLREARTKLASLENAEEDYPYHERIYDAVIEGVPDKARRAMFTHLDVTEKKIRAWKGKGVM